MVSPMGDNVGDDKWWDEKVIVTPCLGKVYSTTIVGAYKSSKCHIVVFWRLK